MNDLFPLSHQPLYQSEAWCTPIHMKMSFIKFACRNETSFLYGRMGTKTRFEKEAKGTKTRFEKEAKPSTKTRFEKKAKDNSEMIYWRLAFSATQT